MTRMITLVLVFSIGLSTADDTPIALVTKSTGQASYRKYSDSKLTPFLAKASELFDNDFIKTGEDGFVKYIYLDDGTTIKITAYAEIYVRGTVKGAAINKLINVDNGTLKFEVSPQHQTEFRIVTPTSVASVKGTVFWLKCNRTAGDQFFGLEGTVTVTNNTSRKSVSLGVNTLALSLPNGELTLRPTKPDDLKVLPKIDDEGEDSGDNELRLNFQNGAGDPKQLIIKYK